MSDSGCLSDDTVLRFVQGTLDAPAAEQAEAHISRCAECRRVLADTAKFAFEESTNDATAGDDAEGNGAPLLPGGKVSRYEIIDLMGTGASGVVYSAFDPELNRRVALKVIKPEAGARSREALIREAQAMARLSHPNVVAVYDAGTFAGGVFVVMELVEGTTLSQWLGERPRAWREKLTVLIEAGRGLAAAHEADIVHGDFKPQNVLISARGRARVSDFGLATLSPGLGRRPSRQKEAVTVSGTPQFMAPEQFLGAETDPATDQFAFCVTSWMALYGQHPFFAEERPPRALRRLVAAVLAGHVLPAPRGARVPAWVEAALRRGLARRSEERHESMAALLAALEAGLAVQAQRRPLRLLGVAVTAIGLALAGGLAFWRGRPQAERRTIAAVCGNGVVEPGEACDDGNDVDTDGCLAGCRRAVCGDGKVRAGVEECEPDPASGGGATCTTACLRCPAESGGAVVVEVGGSCFSRHDDPLVWEAANDACRGRGGHLLTLGPQKGAALPKLLGGSSADFWVGLGDPSGFVGQQWITGEPLSPFFRDLTIKAFGGQPILRARTCFVHGLSTPWAGRPCDAPAGYLCERDGWALRPEDNHAYRALFREKDWPSARALCSRMGAHLAVITDAAENAFLADRFAGTYWVGATRTEPQGRFAWISGGPVVKELFGANDPDLAATPACVVLGEDRKLHDRFCDGREGRYGVLCEID